MNEYIVMNGIDEMGLIIASRPDRAVQVANKKYVGWTHMTRGEHTVIQNQKR